MPDISQYPEETCTTIDFGEVPNLNVLPFKSICSPVPPLFNEEQPETYFGFATSCVDTYGAGYFIINGLDSGKVLEGALTGVQEVGLDINKAGVYIHNGKLIRVEKAMAIPGMYQTSAFPANSTFLGAGHPAIIQKIYLNNTDPTLEISQLPPDAQATAEDLASSAKDLNTIWIASPLTITIVKPAKVVTKSDINEDTVEVDIAVGEAATLSLRTRKATNVCLPAGTTGIAILQTADTAGCSDGTPLWGFIPTTLERTAVVKAVAPTPKGNEGDFVVVSSTGVEGATAEHITAVAGANFDCEGQLGLVTLQDCVFTAIPYGQNLTINTQAQVSECANGQLVKITVGENPEVVTAIRGDYIAGADTQTLPVGTPGLLLTESNTADSCAGPVVKFFPSTSTGTTVVAIREDYNGENTTSEFQLNQGALLELGAQGAIQAMIEPPGSVMCRGDLGVMFLKNDCTLYVTPIAQSSSEMIPAVTTTDSSGITANLLKFVPNIDTNELGAVAAVVPRGDIDQNNFVAGGDCVIPFLPKGTKGFIRQTKVCGQDTKELFYPTDIEPFFVGVPKNCLAFAGQPTLFTAVPDSLCNIAAGVDVSKTVEAEALGDILCCDDKALVYYDASSNSWKASPLSNSIIGGTQVFSYPARLVEDLSPPTDKARIEIRTQDGWLLVDCPVSVEPQCLVSGSTGTYQVIVSGETVWLSLMKSLIAPYRALPALKDLTRNDIYAALTSLANEGIYPACGAKIDNTPISECLSAGDTSEFIPDPTFMSRGIAQDAAAAGAMVEVRLYQTSSAFSDTVIRAKLIHPVEKGGEVTVRYEEDGEGGCAWMQLPLGIPSGIFIVDTNACLLKDTKSGPIDIKVTPRYNIPVKSGPPIKAGEEMTVRISDENSLLKFLIDNNVCVPAHCGGTAIYNHDDEEWSYLPPPEVTSVSTSLIPAEVVQCNDTNLVTVIYEGKAPNGDTISITEAVNTGQLSIPVGTPGNIQILNKKLCDGETATERIFLPIPLTPIPIIADVPVGKGAQHEFPVNREKGAAAPAAARPAVTRGIYTGSIISPSDRIMAVSGDDFCEGDTGVATPDGCLWKVSKDSISDRVDMRSGVILSKVGQENITNTDQLPTQIDAMIFGQKCRVFTNHQPIEDPVQKYGGSTGNNTMVMPGQKVVVRLTVQDKECAPVVSGGYTNHVNDIEAYAMAPTIEGNNCMVWKVRINCQYYWLCMPMQTMATVVTVVTHDNYIDPSDCSGTPYGKSHSISTGNFVNPLTGNRSVSVPCNEYTQIARPGDRFVAAMSHINGVVSWNISPLPGFKLYAAVCWNVKPVDVANVEEKFHKRYHLGVLLDATGKPITDSFGDPTIIGVRIGDQVLPTKVGDKALYVVQEEEKVYGAEDPDSDRRPSRWFVLAEDAVSGQIPYGYKQGEKAQNAPSPAELPETPAMTPLPDRCFMIGAPIDRGNAPITVDVYRNNTADVTCPKQQLVFVLNENWSTVSTAANWKWGKVNRVVGRDRNDNLAISAHEVVPFNSQLMIAKVPEIKNQETYDAILAGTRNNGLIFSGVNPDDKDDPITYGYSIGPTDGIPREVVA